MENNNDTTYGGGAGATDWINVGRLKAKADAGDLKAKADYDRIMAEDSEEVLTEEQAWERYYEKHPEVEDIANRENKAYRTHPGKKIPEDEYLPLSKLISQNSYRERKGRVKDVVNSVQEDG